MIVVILIFARLLSALLLATSVVPMGLASLRFRVAAAAILTALLSPILIANAVETGLASNAAILAVPSEVLFGACFGFGLCLWFVGAEVCATLWGHLSGLSIDVFATADSRPWTRFFQLTWICVFFLSGGHRTAMQLLLDSFELAPPAQSIGAGIRLDDVFVLFGQSMKLGLQAGLPVATTLLATLGVTALVSRTIPHIQTLVTSTSLGALMLIVALAIGFGPLILTLDGQVSGYLASFAERWSVMRQGP